MNTIEIYLKESGSTALISVDFRIFQNSYRNKLIDIYVPKTLLVSNQQGTYMNAVKIGAILTSATGEKVNTIGYYADYVEDKVVNNVNYAVYELTMPNTFTTEVGVQQLVINVVNINVNNYVQATVTDETTGTYYTKDGNVYTAVTLPDEYDSETTYYKQVPVVMEIMTSQVCNITVLESAYLGEDEPLDPTELEIVNARLNTIDGEIDDLQSDVSSLQITVGQNTQDIAQNAQDIADIKSSFSQGENYIGTITSSTAPIVGGVVPSGVKTTLNNYVQSQLGRAPKVGDTIIYIYQINGTDKNYKMIYGNDWSGYEIPPMELASNGTAGLVSGTYNVGDTSNTLVNIVGGKIVNIYVKDTVNNVYKDIYSWINTLQGEEDATDSALTNLSSGLANGTIIVKKAYEDGNGNNIVNTYMTQNAGATKQYVKDYALPKVFNDIYYITSEGYTLEAPTDVNPQFTITTSAIGETQAFQLVRDTTAQYELSSKNSYQNKIYLTSDHNCDIILRLETEAYVNGAWVDLRTELSNTISLVANDIQNVTFGSAFLDLGDNVLSIVEGDKIRQTLTIITEHSQQTTFEIYSNTTYPSTFALETTSVTQIVQAGEIGQERVYEAVGTLDNGTITFELPINAVVNLQTEAEFKLSYVGTPNDNDEMVLALGQENYRLVTPSNLLSGNATVSDMGSVANYTQSGTKYWIFKGFIELQGSDTIVRVDTSDLSTKQDLTLSGASDPTTSTVGKINQLYRTTTTNKVFICTAVTAQGTDPETYLYTWSEVGSGMDVLTGSSDPTSSVIGEVGQVYINTSKHTTWICLYVNGNTYRWFNFGGNSNPSSDDYSVIIGSANSSSKGVAIGKGANARSWDSVVIGTGSAYNNGISIGSANAGRTSYVNCIAIGNGTVCSADNAIQLGQGTNNKASTLQVASDNIYNHSSHTLTVQNIALNGTDINTVIDNKIAASIGNVSQLLGNTEDL